MNSFTKIIGVAGFASAAITATYFLTRGEPKSPIKAPVHEIPKVPSIPKIDSTAIIDSFMKLQVYLPPIQERAHFDEVAAKEFAKLAKETGGKFTVVRDVGEVVGTAQNIIRRNLSKGTDVLLLVDKTGSMSDDIETIKKGLHKIVNELRKQPDVRCGMAFYGDKNEDANWFNYLNFSTEFDSILARINDVKADGGGDLPESVYDGFFESWNKMNWDPLRKKMVLLIGDAPSLDSTKATYQLSDVVKLSKEQDIAINLYPMLLATNDGDKEYITRPRTENIIAKIYPNPTRGEVKLETSRYGNWELQIYNQAGWLMRQIPFGGMQASADLSSFSDGLYVFRLIDRDSRTVETEKILLQK